MVSNVVDDDDDAEVDKSVKKKAGRKVGQSKKAPLLPPREASGYNFTGIDKDTGDKFEYDVPFLDVAKWYRILVRKSSERKLCESFLEVAKLETSRWSQVIVDAYYPKLYLVRYKNTGGKRGKGKDFVDAKELVQTAAPMVPGVLFIKCKMNPEIAEDLEAIQSVRYLAKNEDELVLPLSEEEEAQLEILKEEPAPELSPEVKLLRTGEYVSVISGRHAGKYGIIQGSSGGKITVLLRTEYKDYQDNIELTDLQHLPNPPEKNYKTMTAKEAVEALMIKEPNSEMLRFLRKEGLLNEILYPDGRPDRPNRMKAKAPPLSGREGGASLRSISKEESTNPVPESKKPRLNEPDLSDFFSSLEPQEEIFGEDKREDDFADVKAREERQSTDTSAPPNTNYNSVDTNIRAPVRSWSPKSTSPNAYPQKSTNRYDNKQFNNRNNNNNNNRDRGNDRFESYDFKSSNGLGYDYSSTRENSNLSDESKKKSDDFDRFAIPSLKHFIPSVIEYYFVLSFIEQMLKEVDGGRDSAQTESPKKKYTSVPVVNDDFDMDWLDALQPSQSASPSNDRTRPRSADLNNLDSESVLDDLIKELKLGDNNGKASSTGGGGWESRSSRKTWDPITKNGVKKTKQGSGSFSSPAPKEDQFDSFEAYLDALVNFEKKGTPAAVVPAVPAAVVPAAVVVPAAEKKWGKPDKDSIYSSARLDFEADDSLDSFFLEERDESEGSNQGNDYSSSGSSTGSPPVAENKEVPSLVDDSISAVGKANGDLNSLSVKELKERLKGKGMKVSGTKAELIDRLLQ
eukprot:gene25005-33509_t